jgi:hypothetical protein
VLLSLRTASYHTLDEVGSVLWDVIGAGTPMEQVIQSTVATCDADSDAAGQIREFILTLLDRGLIAADAPRDRVETTGEETFETLSADESTCPTVPTTAACIVALGVISMALRTIGLERTWRHAHGKRKPFLRLHQSYGAALSRRVALASTLCPLKSQCLEQSLLVLWHARRAGIDAHLRFGVLQYPFTAHAWVEVDGVAINDNADRLTLYRTFPVVDWNSA